MKAVLLVALLIPSSALADEVVVKRREKMIQVIETVRIAKLTEALELDTEAAEKLFPVIRPFNERRAQAGKARMEAMQGIRREMEGDTPDPKKIADLMDSFAAAQRDWAKVGDEEYTALKKILDPITLARYYRFQMEFEREVKGILKDFKAEKAGKFRERRNQR